MCFKILQNLKKVLKWSSFWQVWHPFTKHKHSSSRFSIWISFEATAKLMISCKAAAKCRVYQDIFQSRRMREIMTVAVGASDTVRHTRHVWVRGWPLWWNIAWGYCRPHCSMTCHNNAENTSKHSWGMRWRSQDEMSQSDHHVWCAKMEISILSFEFFSILVPAFVAVLERPPKMVVPNA